MKKVLFVLGLGFFLLYGAQARATLERSHHELNPNLLREILEFFPEGREIDPRWLDFPINPNLHLHQDAEVSITFIDEAAAQQNSFGYFLYQDLNDDGQISEPEILKQEIIFENTSKRGSGGYLESGDTVTLGKFPAGTRMGFFLISNGHRRPGTSYYTLDAFNLDGHRHLAMVATAEQQDIVLGIEDLPWAASDHDYNDLLFTFTTNPKSALLEVIADGHIPGPTPTPKSNPIAEAENSPGLAQGAAPQADTKSESPIPSLLEGSGQACQLQPLSRAETSWRYYYFGKGCLLLMGLAKWRHWRVNRAASTIAIGETSPEKFSPLYRLAGRD